METSDNIHTVPIKRKKVDFVLGWMQAQLDQEEAELERQKSYIRHDNHLEIMRDIGVLAMMRMSDPEDGFDTADYLETLRLIQEAVEDPDFVWSTVEVDAEIDRVFYPGQIGSVPCRPTTIELED